MSGYELWVWVWCASAWFHATGAACMCVCGRAEKVGSSRKPLLLREKMGKEDHKRHVHARTIPTTTAAVRHGEALSSARLRDLEVICLSSRVFRFWLMREKNG